MGGFLEMCPFESCINGSCGGEPACGADGTDLIYVVDEVYRLHSFNPRDDANEFRPIGNIDCPAGASWPGWPGTGAATPFSMSVDRTGRAWVLYTSGEIFWVDIDDASCQSSGFSRGQSGFELFGMGFVSDAAGSDSETLYIAGGSAGAVEVGDLGAINPGTLQVSTVGPLAQHEYGPELTGTGDGELYGYYPGLASTFVAEIDRSTAQRGQSWNLSALGVEVRAWAFAHWGGRFYIFITTVDLLFGDTRSQVILLDPNGGTNTVLLDSDLGDDVPIVVGAGVSTCAPIEVP